MKRIAVVFLALALALTLASCSGTGSVRSASGAGSDSGSAAPADGYGQEQDAVPLMTNEEFASAGVGAPITVETYIQAKQIRLDGKASFYTQSEDGAYFIYQMPCTQEEYDALSIGDKIRVSGTKSEWSGEIEITDAVFEMIEGAFIATPLDLTAIIGGDELAAHQNEMVTFKRLTVEPKTDASGNEVAFLYNWDGKGKEGDDLYFDASTDGGRITFTVESDLCGTDSAVYKAVKALRVGDVINVTGFLYWYNGANPHVIVVSPAD